MQGLVVVIPDGEQLIDIWGDALVPGRLILGEAWLFLSIPLVIYAGEAAIVCHLFVIGYEEPTLRRRFGSDYEEYRRSVHR